MEPVKTEASPDDRVECSHELMPIAIKKEETDWSVDIRQTGSYAVEVKLEDDQPQNGLCRCCLSQGNFHSMDSKITGERNESYAEQLQSNLGLTLTRLPSVPLICTTCIDQLTQAIAFRMQVIAAERAFVALEVTIEEYSDDGTSKCLDTVATSLNKYTLDTNLSRDVETEGGLSEIEDNWEDAPLSTIPPAKPRHIAAVSPGPVTKDKRKYNELKKTIKCDDCAKTFKTVTSRNKHADKIHKRCRHCKKVFLTVLQKKEHINTEHGFDCKECNQIFANRSEKDFHLRKEHGQQCRICKKRFKSQFEGMRHRAEVHGAPKFQCGACDTSFFQQSHLKHHQRKVHMKEKHVACPQCSFMCYNNVFLNKHMKSHSSEKEYECKYCKKRFARKTNLQCHERIHTGDKRSVCKLCGEAFVQRASLKYHLEKHHPGDVY